MGAECNDGGSAAVEAGARAPRVHEDELEVDGAVLIVESEEAHRSSRVVETAFL